EAFVRVSDDSEPTLFEYGRLAADIGTTMKIAFTDKEHFVITTAGGTPVSESFTDLLQAEAVLILLTACGIIESDLSIPRHAAYTSTIGGVKIGFREEWGKNFIWLVRQPAWIMIVD